MPNEKRETFIKVRFTEAETIRLDENKKKSGVKTRSAYIRKMALDGYILHTDFTQMKSIVNELTTAVNRIGVNINQITKRLNETNHFYADDANEIRKGMADIWQLLKSGLSSLRQTLR